MNDLKLKKLKEIVGDKNATSDPDTMELYSEDQSFSQGCRPQYVVYPEETEQVQEIIKFANEEKLPVIPRSSQVSLHGSSLPKEGGLLVDLKKMNKILEVDEKNRYAVIQPGVTFKQLNDHVNSKGFRVAKPLLDPPSASVVSSFMERNPVVQAADFTFGTEHIMTYTIISPTGDPFTIGHPPLENTPASAPDGPGLNFYRIFQGAQGTLGIVTWMIIRLLPLEKAQKLFFMPCESAERAVLLMKSIQEKELGLECFALNDFDMASMLIDENENDTKSLEEGTYIGQEGTPPWNEKQYEQFNELQENLPPWTVVVSLSAIGPLPEEKIAYQELDLKEVAVKAGAEVKPTVGGVTNLNKIIADEINLSKKMQKRFGFRGSCHQLMFATTADRVDDYLETVTETAGDFNYPPEDIGIYIQPMERGRAFYISVDLHCDLANDEDLFLVSDLYDQLSEILIEDGAFFDRPYGKWAELVYSKTGKYAEYLRMIKKELDPNNIMNPGKLCF